METNQRTCETRSTTGGAPDSGRVRGPRLLSTSLARLPLLCAIRRSVRLGLARHRGTIGGLIALALAGLYARARFRRRQADAALVPGLVDVVLDRLANQKLLSEEEGEEVYEPFLFLPHLRDDVLRSIHSARERERIWSLVRPIVELNSNVRTSQREGRHGDVGRAWEWIGAVGAADDGVESAARRRRSRSARVSWGKDVRGGSGDDESTLQKLDEAAAKEPEMVERPTGGPANPNPARIGLHQKWEDSRPIY